MTELLENLSKDERTFKVNKFRLSANGCYCRVLLLLYLRLINFGCQKIEEKNFYLFSADAVTAADQTTTKTIGGNQQQAMEEEQRQNKFRQL